MSNPAYGANAVPRYPVHESTENLIFQTRRVALHAGQLDWHAPVPERGIGRRPTVSFVDMPMKIEMAMWSALEVTIDHSIDQFLVDEFCSAVIGAPASLLKDFHRCIGILPMYKQVDVGHRPHWKLIGDGRDKGNAFEQDERSV